MYDPVVICTTCGETGHTTASCHYTKAEYKSDLSYEDEIFWSYIDPRDRPESLREEDSNEVLEGSPSYSAAESEEYSDMEEDFEQAVGLDRLEDSDEIRDDMEVDSDNNISEEEELDSEVEAVCSDSESNSDEDLYDLIQ